MKSFKTSQESAIGPAIAQLFQRSGDSIEHKLETFPRYARRQHLKRFLAMYEVYKIMLPIKGSIIECGVFRGFGFMSWLKLGAILEPENLTRRVYGFDTFEGFPTLSEVDKTSLTDTHVGDMQADSYDELCELISLHDQDRFLGHIPKGHLIRGDIARTAPQFIRDNPHLVVSMLFLDADLFEPTKAALEAFVPRMPRGALLVFDELDNPQWPGETLAALNTIGLNKLRLERLEWDPYISWARIEL
jgi:hypothetical protein